jgi:hypothetical protein
MHLNSKSLSIALCVFALVSLALKPSGYMRHGEVLGQVFQSVRLPGRDSPLQQSGLLPDDFVAPASDRCEGSVAIRDLIGVECK